MQELDDIGLLREYVERDSEAAFAALVERHINKIYSVALRHTSNPHQAEEITQAVFVILARKSRQLSRGVILYSWLYKTARLTSAAFIRGEIRRSRREQEACMQNVNETSESEVWPQIAPLLDAALAALNETDRRALMLRFFYGKSMKEIGADLDANEDATKKRVGRALEKLQNYFFKHGVRSTTAALENAILANSVLVAPAALAKIVTAVALAKGAAASSSTLTLIKGVLKLMVWTKAKTAIVVGVGVLLAAGTTTAIIHRMHMERQPVPQLQTLTLKVNPDLFIKNLMAEAGDTMNTSSNHWGDILMDLLRIQGVSCNPPRGIAFNTKTGEITTQNTPDALDKFRQTVEELNQPDGRCDSFSRIPVKQEMLFAARFYKMSSLDFDQLGLGQPSAKATRYGSGWWILEPKGLNQINQKLQSHGFKPFQTARIDTGYGIASDFYMGTSAQNIDFECLPIALVENPFGKEQMIDLKVKACTTGYFTSNPAGDWPEFAGRTNCALFAEVNVENGGAVVFRAHNPSDSENSELVVLLEATIKSTK